MAYQPLEELLPKAGNSVYQLVRLASKRATELADNGKKLIAAPIDQKLATTALEEIRAGKVVEKRVAAEFDPKGEKVKKNGKTKA